MSYPPTLYGLEFRDVSAQSRPYVAVCGGQQCSLVALDLQPGIGPVQGHSVSHDSASQDPPHVPLQAGQPGRRRIACGAETLFISWALDGHAHVNTAIIEIFGRADTPLIHFRKIIRWEDGATQATGSTPFNGSIAAGAHAVATSGTVTVPAPTYQGAAYPDDFLTAEHAPYKLKMTIASDDQAVQVMTAVRWIYLDVEISRLQVFLGPERIIPTPTSVASRGYSRRLRTLRTAIAGQLNPVGSLDSNHVPAVDIDLEGNLFGAEIAEWRDNSAFQAWRAAWRDGPLIPLVAQVGVRAYDGTTVQAPLALGGSKFLWDWSGSPHASDYFHAYDRAELDGALNTQLAQCPTGLRNAHTSFGGKRGPTARVFDTADHGHGNYVDGGAGRFPFPASPCAQRVATAVSQARTAGDFAGSTGVLFWPSIQAGDQYTLRVYFAYAYPALWDVASTAEQMAADPPLDVPRARTAPFTVRRVVRVARHWTTYQNGTFDATSFDWRRLATRYFEPAGITLDISAVDGNPTPIPVPQYRQLYATAIQTLPELVRNALGGVDEQLEGHYGIKFEAEEDFRSTVELLYFARLRAITRRHRLPNPVNPIAETLERIQLRGETLAALAYDQVQTDPGSMRQAFQNYRVNIAHFNDAQDVQNITAGGIRNNVHTALNLPLAVPPYANPAQALRLQTRIDEIQNVVQQITATPTPEGDADCLFHIQRFVSAGRTWDARCKSWGSEILIQICTALSTDPLNPAGEGLQIFQFDFADNFDNFPNSGEAFSTPSNRTACPECDQALNDVDRENRRCPRLQCGARLRTNASVLSYIPWHQMQGFSTWTMYNLQRNRDKYLFLTNMEGACPEVLVGHEMGHHLFIPHAPHGFRPPDPLPDTWIWRAYRLAVYLYPGFQAFMEERTAPGGAEAAYHATNHHACIMGYNFAEMPDLHFCFKCALRLRGWSGDPVRLL